MLATDTIQELLNWSANSCNGYRGVAVKNMNSSWRDGLAFCALIHRYRPDLIDYHSLKLGDIRHNNELAFRIAREHFGILELIDVSDLEKGFLDPLCIATYVSTYRNYFRTKQPIGDPTVRVRVGNEYPVNNPSSVDQHFETDADRENAANADIDANRRALQSSNNGNGPVCEVCKQRVFILDRTIDGSGRVCHKSCAISGEIEHLLSAKRERECTLRRRTSGNAKSYQSYTQAAENNNAPATSPTTIIKQTSHENSIAKSFQSAAQIIQDSDTKAEFIEKYNKCTDQSDAKGPEVSSKSGEAGTDKPQKMESHEVALLANSALLYGENNYSRQSNQLDLSNNAQSGTSPARIRNPFAPDRPPPPKIVPSASATPVTRHLPAAVQSRLTANSDALSTETGTGCSFTMRKHEYPKALNPFELDEPEHLVVSTSSVKVNAVRSGKSAPNPFEVDEDEHSDVSANTPDAARNGTSAAKNDTARSSPSGVLSARTNPEKIKFCTGLDRPSSRFSTVPSNLACSDADGTTKSKPIRPALPPQVIADSQNATSSMNSERVAQVAPCRRLVRTTKEFGGSQTYDEILDALTVLRTRQVELEKRARELERVLRNEEVQTLVALFKINESATNSPISSVIGSEVRGSRESIKSAKKKKPKKQKHKRGSSGDRALKSASLNDRLVREWFALVRERAALFTQESELMSFARLRQLDDLHSDIEFELRRLQHKRERGELDDSEQAREDELISQLSRIVQDRSQLCEQIVELLSHDTEENLTSQR